MKKTDIAKLLERYSIIKPPVSLERIVEGEGISLLYTRLDPDMSGALVESEEFDVIIAVNDLHHRNRQRFTIAHELGHFFLNHLKTHPHIDREFTVIPRNQISSEASDSREMAANHFAANLLMPETFLLRDFVRTGGFIGEELGVIARRYQVSELALSYRLANLGLLPPY